MTTRNRATVNLWTPPSPQPSTAVKSDRGKRYPKSGKETVPKKTAQGADTSKAKTLRKKAGDGVRKPSGKTTQKPRGSKKATVPAVKSEEPAFDKVRLENQLKRLVEEHLHEDEKAANEKSRSKSRTIRRILCGLRELRLLIGKPCRNFGLHFLKSCISQTWNWWILQRALLASGSQRRATHLISGDGSRTISSTLSS
jgi:hypothetical protein